MNRRALISLAMGAALLPAGGCTPHQNKVRFRLTMRALAGSRVVEASSVRETWYTDDPPWFPSDGAGQFGWRGEATILDLGAGRLLAAMLDGYTTLNGYRERSYAPWNPHEVLVERIGQTLPRLRRGQRDWSDVGGLPDPREIRKALQRGPLILEPHELPVLVAFATPDVPGSGRVIQPAEVPAMFPDVRLGRCRVELTHRPVGFGQVERHLPWVMRGPGHATVYKPPFKAGLVVNGDFQRR